MARQVQGRALWNRSNKQENGLLITHPRYSDILNNKRPSLVSTVQPASLWPHLRKYNVLGEHLQEKITLNTTRAEQVDKLFNHLEHGPTWQLHSFLRACSLTDQGHIIRDIGLNPELYEGPSPPDSDNDDSDAVSVDDTIQDEPGDIGSSPQTSNSTGDVLHVCQKEAPLEPPLKRPRCSTDGEVASSSMSSDSSCVLMTASQEESIPSTSYAGQRKSVCTSQSSKDVSDRGPQPRVEMKPERHLPGKFEKTLTEALVVHCEYYKDHLMTGRVFDFKHHDTETMFYDVDECYMQQDAELWQYKSVADRIKMQDVLRRYGIHPMPRTVLLVGHPGVGKSTFFTRFAYCWSLEFLKYLSNPGVNKCPEQTVVVYVPARSLTTDIWGSIESELCCRGNGRKSIMNIIQSEEPIQEHLSAILIDHIDEIRDEKILQALQAFLNKNLKHGGPQIIVTARTGLSQLDKSIFDRFLNLEGFTLSQGIEYTHKYITQNWKGNGAREPSVLGFIDRNKEALTPILCNPLKAHLLSALAVEGLLEQNDENIPESVELLMMVESFFIKRETDGKGVSFEESGMFYKLCLYGLLANIRQFTEDDLFRFKVQHSPYVSFFRKETRRDKSANNVSLYSFEHEVLYEFFAARAIKTLPEWKIKAVLLYVGSRKILGNLQKLLVVMLSQQNSLPLLVGMVRLILICGSLDERSVAMHISPELINYASKLEALRGIIQNNLSQPEDLLLYQESGDDSAKEGSLSTWKMVDTILDMLVQLMNTNQSPHTHDYWAHKYFSKGGLVKKVITNMLTDCTMTQQEEIASGTYFNMLPCSGFYPCGNMRWVELRSNYIQGWSPEDMANGIAQHRNTNTVTGRVNTYTMCIDFRYTPSQWGRAADNHWTCTAWETALQALVAHYNITDGLQIYLPDSYSAPLDGLVYSIANLDESDFPGWNIEIQHGGITLQALHHVYQVSGNTYNRNRKISLHKTSLQLSADEQTREGLLQWVGAQILLDVKRHVKYQNIRIL